MTNRAINHGGRVWRGFSNIGINMLGISYEERVIFYIFIWCFNTFHRFVSSVRPSVMVDVHVAERKLNFLCQTVHCDSVSLPDPTACHYCAVSSVCDKWAISVFPFCFTPTVTIDVRHMTLHRLQGLTFFIEGSLCLLIIVFRKR